MIKAHAGFFLHVKILKASNIVYASRHADRQTHTYVEYKCEWKSDMWTLWARGGKTNTHTHAVNAAWSLTTGRDTTSFTIAIKLSNKNEKKSNFAWELCCKLDSIENWNVYLSNRKTHTFEPRQGDVTMHRKKPETKNRERKKMIIKN